MALNDDLLSLASAALDRRRTNWSQRAAVVVGIIAAVSVALLWWANAQWRDSYATFLPAVDSLQRARQATVRAFVLQNDMLADDKTVSRQEIEAQLDRAALSAADAATGRSGMLGIAGRPPGGDLARDIAAYQKALDNFRRATEVVIRHGAADPAAHVAHRAAFGEAELLARKISSELSIRLGKEIADQQVGHRVGVVLWVAFIGVALLLLARAAGEQRRHNSNRQLLTSLIESCEEGIYVKRLDGRIVLGNAACGKLLGRPVGELRGKRSSEVFSVGLAQQAEHSDRMVIETKRQIIDEVTLDQDSGTQIIVQVAKGPVLDEDGRVVGTYGIVRDVTALREEDARRQHSARLESELDILRDVLENSFAGYWDWNIPSDILFMSPALLAMLGHRPGDIPGTGQGWKSLVLPEDLPRAEEALRRHLASRGRLPYYVELRYLHKDGSHVWLISSGRVVEWNAHDEPLRMVGCQIDVTPQHLRTRELGEARERAEAASRAKSEFLANMSHEIRTPLNGILGLAYVLETAGDSARTRAMGRRIHQTGDALLGIISDILDFSKIEAGHLTLERRPFWLGELLDEIRQLGGALAIGKSLNLKVDPSPVNGQPLLGDPLRLKQVLGNLIGNAVKFTEAGEVSVAVGIVHQTAQSVALRFAIRDTGVGISPQQIETIFAPFVQADASTTRRFGGTGLGLSISQRIVGLMGGQLQVTSTPGVGSEFSFEVLFDLAAHDAIAMPSAIQPPAVRVDGPRIDGLRVLVVDDSEINREVAGLILEGVGARVTVAENGAQALELLKAEPQGFDVVLLDIQMPVLDGYETTRALRQIPEFESLPIFALTAGALSEQREVALAAGMNGFISKPFSAEALIACLAELPRARSPAGSATPRSVPLAAAPAPSSRAAPPPVFDDKAHASLWKNPDRYRSTLCSFLDEHRDDGARIRVALAAAPADWVKARQLAHKLAGAAGNMAFPQVAAAAREIEAALLGQRDAGAQVSELEAALHAAAALAEERFGAAAEGRSPPGRAVGDAKDKAPVHTAPEAGFDRAILVGALHYALDRADRAALLALLNQASLPPADAAALRACVERGDFAGASAQLEQYAQQGADEEMVGRAGLEPATKGL